MRNYYKVVCEDANGLFSMSKAICKKKPSKSTILRYRKGRWTRPILKGTKLFCYKSLFTAACATAYDPRLRVWKCEVRGAVADDSASPYQESLAVRYFWAEKGKRTSSSLRKAFDAVFPGMFQCSAVASVHADEIKLVSEVRNLPRIPSF